jgi:hypothetical protein
MVLTVSLTHFKFLQTTTQGYSYISDYKIVGDGSEKFTSSHSYHFAQFVCLHVHSPLPLQTLKESAKKKPRFCENMDTILARICVTVFQNTVLRTQFLSP